MRSILLLALVSTAFHTDVIAAPAAPERPAIPALLDALTSAAVDVGKAEVRGPDLAKRIDQFTRVRYSDETRQKLRKVFGREQFYSLQRSAGKDGTTWKGAIAAGTYQPEAGAQSTWSQADFSVHVDPSRRKLTTTGSWPSVQFGTAQATFRLDDLRWTSRQQLGFANMLFGTSSMTLGRVTVGGNAPPVSISNVRFDSNTVEHPRTMDISQRTRLAQVEVAGETIENIELELGLVNLDKRTLAALTSLERQVRQLKRDPASLKQLSDSLRRLAASRNAAVELRRLAATMHGHTMEASGRLWIEGALPAGAELAELKKRLRARFDIKVPLKLIDEVSLRLARQQATKKGATNEEEIARLARVMADASVGRLTRGGHARIEDGMLVSRLEYLGDTLTANGKDVRELFPKPADGKSAAADSALRARLVDGSCRVPDFPEDAVRADKPVRLVLRLVAGADGAVREPKVVLPSGWPDFDRAVLDEVGKCRYFPALSAGKPVDSPVFFELKREAGGVRP